MSHMFLFDYVGIDKFLLNKPPFKLIIKVSNFENNESITIIKDAIQFENLPKKLDIVLQQSELFKSYIDNFSNDNNFLHFMTDLYNDVEKVHCEFFSIKLDVIKNMIVTKLQNK